MRTGAELGIAPAYAYWETRFPQLKPMQRAGNRRYYRPADVDLARRINRLLNEEGYTVRGVQKLLGGKPVEEVPAPQPTAPAPEEPSANSIDVFRLIAIRNRLAALVGD